MNSEKPHFLAQPVVKNIFVYRNGDPYYEARRLVINQKRVSNFETFLREVTGGVQPPFGAVRNIYTPRAGHRVDSLEHLQSGEQYVAAGREKFKKLDYQQIGSTRKKRLLQSMAGQVKPVPQSRIIASARFLKPIKEPCAVFLVVNGDVLNPALRLLVPQRVLGQYERVLELVTEKLGFRMMGGVRSLYTFDGTLVNDGKDLENGQFYVAVGREKFKRLPYSDLMFTKPRGTRRVNGSKASSLPPIYRFSKQNGTSKSLAACCDDSKVAAPAGKEQLSSIVREISQARLMTLRKKRSGQGMSLGVPDNDTATDDGDQKSDREAAETGDKTPREAPTEEKTAEDSKNPNTEAPEASREKEVKEAGEVKETEEQEVKEKEVEEAGEKEAEEVKEVDEESKAEKSTAETADAGENSQTEAETEKPSEEQDEEEERKQDSRNDHVVKTENEKEGSRARAGAERQGEDGAGGQVDSSNKEGGNTTKKERAGEKELNGKREGSDSEEEKEDLTAHSKDAKADKSEKREGEKEERNGVRETEERNRETETEERNGERETDKQNVEGTGTENGDGGNGPQEIKKR